MESKSIQQFSLWQDLLTCFRTILAVMGKVIHREMDRKKVPKGKNNKFSVLMSLYISEKAEYFEALFKKKALMWRTVKTK